MKKIISLYKKHREVVTYLVAGVLTTAVNFAVYSLCVELFSLDVTLSNLVAWLFAVTFAFFANKLYVFKSRSAKASRLVYEALTFFASRLLSGAFEVLLPGILMGAGLDQSLFGVDGMLAKLAVSLFVIVFNYVAGKLLVFKRKE